VAARPAAGIGVDLSGEQGGEAAQNRQSGLETLFGIATGLGVDAAYGLVTAAVCEVLR
jgi:hypothetical protein